MCVFQVPTARCLSQSLEWGLHPWLPLGRCVRAAVPAVTCFSQRHKGLFPLRRRLGGYLGGESEAPSKWQVNGEQQ